MFIRQWTFDSVYMATILLHVEIILNYIDMDLLLKPLPEVGFEPTRTYVHWNLSPTP